ncbi:MAG TPA: tetratricopeptide repeat protein [Leptospiraceae bacterium]|nr:tetratricopeptide repeat protein [Leptospiraceae bacterium]HRG76539.1 tetratricopeptide repeat protein [Leptospiraceae bacterium]
MKLILVFFLTIYFSIGVYADNLEPIRKLREAGRFDEAIETLMNSNYTSDIESEMLLAKLYLDKNAYEDAVRVYTRICNVLNTHDCFNELAITYLSMGNYQQAIDEFEKSIYLNRKSAMVYSNLAQAYLIVKKYDKAEEAHKMALKLSSENPIVKVNYGVFLIKTKKYAEAKGILKDVLRENTSMFVAELYLGIAHYMKEEYNSALIHLNRGLLINPESYDLHYHRAIVYYKKGDYINAFLDLKMADKISPDNPKTGELKKLVRQDSKL